MRSGKSYLIIGIMLCMSHLAIATVPTSVTVQGRLTDATGTPVSPGFKSFSFKIYDTETGGTEIWSGETQFVASDQSGLWNASVGAVNPLGASVFADTARWLEVTVDDGINPAETLPRIQLETSPYAFQADRATRADTADVAVSSAPDNDWTLTASLLFSTEFRGILKGNAGNVHHGDSGHTVVDFGYESTTGIAGQHNFGQAIGGGSNNSALGNHSTVAGGHYNIARGDYSTVGGGGGPNDIDSNAAAGFGNVIGGGTANRSNGTNATIGGGWLNVAGAVHATVGGGAINIASGGHSTVGGGRDNDAVGEYSTASGGYVNFAGGDSATVAGGAGNTASGTSSTVGGGRRSAATGNYSTVSGGQSNSASSEGATIAGGGSNSASQQHAVVGGGIGNDVNGVRSTIGGGHFNTIDADYATIAGGSSAFASGPYAALGGGKYNRARGAYSVVAGGGGPALSDSNSAIGSYSTVSGGRRNRATGSFATAAGGYSNLASGAYALVAGGGLNVATGDYSFAGGYSARAENHGSFVWSDASSANTFSSATIGTNSFTVRATGGVFFASGYGTVLPYVGVILPAGASAWTSVCDSTAKTDIRPVDGSDILDKIAELPISRWSYKHQNPPIYHIGPMAQDFYRLFQVGHDDKTISTLDPDGVALAAIKELEKRTRRIDELANENIRLRDELDRLRQLVEALKDQRH